MQLLFSGGITSDGVHNFWPSMANPPVVPLDSALQPLSAASVLGLADLGTLDPVAGCTEVYHDDGDNYLDICLKLDGTTPKPAHVRVLCSQGGVPISPPKGSAYACNATYDVAVVDTTAAPTSSDDNTAVIVGACAGGGALFLTLVAGLLFRARRRTRFPKAASSASAASSTCE